LQSAVRRRQDGGEGPAEGDAGGLAPLQGRRAGGNTQIHGQNTKIKKYDQIELKPLKGAEAGRDFSIFLEVAEQINSGIDEVKRNVEEMRLMQKKILGEPIKSEREKYQVQIRFDENANIICPARRSTVTWWRRTR
jgi:hypothetical protein